MPIAKFFITLLLFNLISSTVFAKKPDVFLCVQEDSKDTKSIKLVYGYILGIKTECMPEKEFLAMYYKKTAEFEKAVSLDTISNSNAIKLIQNGEKNIAGANFAGYDFMNISFREVDLSNVNFNSADLRKTNFQNANCTQTDFSNSFLKGANFNKTDVTAANFNGAYLVSTDFVNAKGLNTKMFESAKSLYRAKFDKKFLEKMKKINPKLFEKPKKCWETNMYISDSTDCDENKKYKFKKIKVKKQK